VLSHDLIGSYLLFSLRPEDPPHLEDMNKEQLQKEIKKEIDEIGKRDEVFVIIIDAVNQVTMAYMLFVVWDVRGIYSDLKMLLLACDLVQHFQDLCHSCKPVNNLLIFPLSNHLHNY